ncbi:MAG: nucleotide exchange factor GrpE [Acidobacteriota bacterium]|nr:nucleotide exchange factor GrpE [Acidobacteriota bacterium]
MDTDKQEAGETEEFEVDGEAEQDLETAMREALEAVEAASRDELDEAKAVPADAEAARESLPVSDGDIDLSGLDELANLRREVAELRDRSVRTLADFDNFRKRSEREREEQRRYAGTEVLREILAVVDNLERALESEGNFKDLKSGVELILRQVLDMLKRHGVERVDANGAFDPGVHEAVSRQEADDVSVPMVQEELQAGYVLKDRLLRPAMVVVAVPQEASSEGSGSE